MTHVVSAPADSSRRGQGVLDDPDMSASSDAGLLIAIARRRSDALAEAYRRHGPSIYFVAERKWGQRQAEQLTMEIFLTLWRRPDAVDLDRRSLRAHLLTHLGRTDTMAGTTPPQRGRVEALHQ